jgi:hypothetical protein
MAYSRAGREMTGQERRGEERIGWERPAQDRTGNDHTTRERGDTKVEIQYGPPWAVGVIQALLLLYHCLPWLRPSRQTHHCCYTVLRVPCGDGYRHVANSIDRLYPVPDSSLVGPVSVVFPV